MSCRRRSRTVVWTSDQRIGHRGLTRGYASLIATHSVEAMFAGAAGRGGNDVILEGIKLAPDSLNEARISLEQTSMRLRCQDDARAVFPDVYVVITEIVEREINGRTGFFLEPGFISRLVPEFARRYLETLAWTVEGRAQDCSAWALAYDYCRLDGVTPLQHAVLGISAHINFDLALGIHATIRRLGYTGDPAELSRYKHDHDAVNELLARSLPEALDRLERVYGCSMTGLLGERTRRHAVHIMLEMLRRWRDLVWTNVVELLQAPDEQSRHRVVLRMERRSRRIGHRLRLIRALPVVLRLAAMIMEAPSPPSLITLVRPTSSKGERRRTDHVGLTLDG
jgi:Family of unknown function (DUF5995)